MIEIPSVGPQETHTSIYIRQQILVLLLSVQFVKSAFGNVQYILNFLARGRFEKETWAISKSINEKKVSGNVPGKAFQKICRKEVWIQGVRNSPLPYSFSLSL
jgi:hypothetical protein